MGSSQMVTFLGSSMIKAPANGYAYIYVSNESRNPVYIDNFQVEHKPGRIVEETHYYPFGLVMSGISSRAASNLENKFKFNKGTELASKEFSDGSGLELYETNFRNLDPQLGRFWQIDPMADYSFDVSPYSFANNNPILFNDPTGLLSDSLHPVLLPEVVVTSHHKNNNVSNNNSWLTALGWSAMGADFYKEMLYKGNWMYKNSKGVVQSIFDTKWGRNKTPEDLGNILNYSKNARAGIRATKVVKVVKVAGKIVIVIGLASDIKDVYNAWKNDSPDALATSAGVGVPLRKPVPVL